MRALVLRELRLALRAGGGGGLALAFFALVVAIAPLGIGSGAEVLRPLGPGLLWIAALLACLLSLERMFARDFADGTLDLLASAPVPLESVVLSKAAAHWLLTGAPLALAAPVLGVLMQLTVSDGGWVALTLLLGTPALSLIGAFGAALTAGLGRGGLLLPVLMLPMTVPVLIFGTEAARRGIEGQGPTPALALLAGASAAAAAGLPFAAAAALRVALRGR